MAASFEAFVRRKTQEAECARISRLRTVVEDTAGRGLTAIGNRWTRDHFDGDFHVSPLPARLPAVALVFVQSRHGNTAAANPDELGGGPTDKHLIYEGLSRVAADAVLAGATTAVGGNVFFSVWHPELVALRRELGLPRHPAQIVVSNDGHVDLEGTLLFNVPDVPVYVLAGKACRDRCAAHLEQRPWVTVIPLDGNPSDAFHTLRQAHTISRISVVGGRTTATRLIDAGLVQDVYLTTTTRDAGEPNTPFYAGTRHLTLEPIVRKRTEDEEPIVFEHFRL